MSLIQEKYILVYRFFGITVFVASPLFARFYKLVIPSFNDPFALRIPIMAIALLVVILSFTKGHRVLLQFLISLLLVYIVTWVAFLNHLNGGLSYIVVANFIAVIFSLNLLPTMRSVIIFSSIAFPVSLLFHYTIQEPQFSKFLFTGLLLVILPIAVIPQLIRLHLEKLLQQAKENILIKNKELLEFTHNVTHDLKKPLAVMKTICSLVASESFSTLNDDGREAVAMGKDAIGYMQELLEDLLTCAKLEAGTQSLELEEVDVKEVVETVVQRLRLQAGGKNINIVRNINGYIYADQKRITRVFMNLIGNAINYIGDKPNPEIIISLSKQQGNNEYLFSVKDNGIGISEEAQSNIFEKFQRGTNISGISGTGLGLSIVKSIIEAHKGKIWLESKEGEGTTFNFTIPKHST